MIMRNLFWLFVVVSFCTFCSATVDPLQERGTVTFSVMTYNIHHAEGRDGVIDIERIADVILQADPDLVALQEVDRFVERTGRADQAQQLAELTGMFMTFGFAIRYQGGDFGNAVLSKFPLNEVKLHPLPGEPGEDRTLMEVSFLLPGYSDPIVLLNTHLDTFNKPRTESVPLILQVIPDSTHQLYVLAGDLNDAPGTPVMEALNERLESAAPPHLFTFPSDKPDRQIDHILFSPTQGWTLEQVHVIQEPTASDHAPMMAMFRYNPQ